MTLGTGVLYEMGYSTHFRSYTFPSLLGTIRNTRCRLAWKLDTLVTVRAPNVCTSNS
jgi:hypothetical protein